MGRVLALVAALWVVAGAGWAAEVPPEMRTAQVVFLGEVHDNPAAHQRQAELVAALQPTALVFEMLTGEQAARVTSDLRTDAQGLEAALGWAESGWPDFAMYAPIFAAAPDAVVRGAAVPRAAARAAMKEGVADSFGDDAAAFGLAQALEKAEQAEREAFQHEAHCGALPDEMLPVMVELQRLRDAVLARAALNALDETGGRGPVVVITGNGHAREDWGAPVYVAKARPDVVLFSLGIVEPGGGGAFNRVEEVPAAEREDPCAAFDKG